MAEGVLLRELSVDALEHCSRSAALRLQIGEHSNVRSENNRTRNDRALNLETELETKL